MSPQQHKISRTFLLYKAVTNLWFVGAVWLYFYRLFVTDQQVGVLDGIAFTIGLIAEVPSGALADTFGRNKLVKIGLILSGCGFLIQVLSPSFLAFVIGQSILMIGVSFVSGADEALFFEKLKFKSNSPEWRKIITRASQVSLVASMGGYVIGGLLHTFNPRFPWILSGLSFIIAALIIWPLKEENTVKTSALKLADEFKRYIHNIHSGFGHFLKPKLWFYIPIIISVQGLFYTTGWGLLRLVLLDRFHFSPFWGAVVVASASFITVGILHVMHQHAHKLNEKKVITFISLLAAASLLFAIPNIGFWGYGVILAIHAGEHLLYPFMSEVVNNHASEQSRATVLSVSSFLRTFPYIFLAPLIGSLNTNGHLEYFFLGWSIFIFLSVLIYLVAKKKDTQIEIA